MTDLTSRLVAAMYSKGITKSRNQPKRRKLELFGGALHIFPDDNGKPLYPDNLSMREPAKENHNLKSIDIQDAVARAAIRLRKDIKIQDVPQAWPPDVKPEVECPTILESLSVFLCYLGFQVQRLVQSLGQEMVYVVTCGRIRPSKHVILPFSVKSLTRNVELINILN